MESQAKIAAGKAAADLIQEGMHVGLGTGSTASCFIESLGKRCREGLKIRAFATSEKSKQLAMIEEIPLLNSETLTSLDVVVDGADEIDPQKRMIKGGGGALLYEKIVAATSKKMIVIIDPHKKVEQLGCFPLPVEIVPFAHLSTIERLRDKGYQGKLRSDREGTTFLTDGGHYIYDIHPVEPWTSPEAVNLDILQTPGVVETGFFLHFASQVVVGFDDGHVEYF